MAKLSVGFLFLSIFMFYPPQQTEAKFWGKDVTHSPSTSADGKC